jgi:hypothetical protein
MAIFYCLGFEHSQPERPCPCILHYPETGWHIYTPRHWVPFRRLLRLAGLRWRYSTPPPHGLAGQGQSQSQTYFRTDGLPSINSSWRQAAWDPRPEIFSREVCCNSPDKRRDILFIRATIYLGYESLFVRAQLGFCLFQANRPVHFPVQYNAMGQ